MPWKETLKLDQRKAFINRMLTENISFTDLCSDFGISRKTGYKWKQRFYEMGYPGLADESRRPESHSKKLEEDVVILIINLKNAHPAWGAKKIQKLMERQSSMVEIPSLSSIKRVLDKAGLVKKKRKKRMDNSQETLRNIIQPQEPNDVWTVDFKGWWWLENRQKCNPLTLRDEKSRFLFDAHIMANQRAEPVREVFTEVFRQQGLPRIIRSDNGSPFAAHNSLLGLTKLSAWWISLGILPDRIQPGKPYQNGGHERMHLDIKKEIQPLYRTNPASVQAVLDEWRHEFNYIRPHEALDMETPSAVYRKSNRKYKGDPDEIIYPLGFESRKVAQNGCIKFRNTSVGISTALSGHHLGLDEDENGCYNVWLNNFMLGKLDMNLLKFYPRKKGV